MILRFLKEATPFKKGDIVEIQDRFAFASLRVGEAEVYEGKAKALSVKDILARNEEEQAKKAEALKAKAESLNE